MAHKNTIYRYLRPMFLCRRPDQDGVLALTEAKDRPPLPPKSFTSAWTDEPNTQDLSLPYGAGPDGAPMFAASRLR